MRPRARDSIRRKPKKEKPKKVDIPKKLFTSIKYEGIKLQPNIDNIVKLSFGTDLRKSYITFPQEIIPFSMTAVLPNVNLDEFKI
jgi:hypothetical protein